MDIEITARHVSITDAVKDHARSKLSKVEVEFPRIDSIHVILDAEKYRYTAEIIVQAKKFLRLEAKETTDDMYAAIDTAVDRIEKRLRKSVDKKHLRKPGLKAIEPVEALEVEGGAEG